VHVLISQACAHRKGGTGYNVQRRSTSVHSSFGSGRNVSMVRWRTIKSDPRLFKDVSGPNGSSFLAFEPLLLLLARIACGVIPTSTASPDSVWKIKRLTRSKGITRERASGSHVYQSSIILSHSGRCERPPCCLRPYLGLCHVFQRGNGGSVTGLREPYNIFHYRSLCRASRVRLRLGQD